MLTRCNIPGVSLPTIPEHTPFVDIPIYGDHLEFNTLNVSFQVSEDLKNYLEIHSWIRKLAKAEDFEEFKSLSKVPEYTGLGLSSEITLTILDSSNQPSMTFTFHTCYPIALSDMIFDAQSVDVKYIVATAEFKYMNFDYERSA